MSIIINQCAIFWCNTSHHSEQIVVLQFPTNQILLQKLSQDRGFKQAWLSVRFAAAFGSWDKNFI